MPINERDIVWDTTPNLGINPNDITWDELPVKEPLSAGEYQRAMDASSLRTRIKKGLGGPALKAAELVGMIPGAQESIPGLKHIINDIERTPAEKAQGMEIRYGDPNSTDWAGGIAGMVPAGVVGKGLASLVPKVAGMTGLAGLGARSALSGTTGGVAAGMQPGSDWSDVGQGTAFGLGFSPVADVGRAIVKTAYQASQPFTESGRAAILREFRLRLLGNDKKLTNDVIAALEKPGEIVRGSQPTAGELMAGIPGATGLAAHEKDIARLPGISPKFAERFSAQEQARLRAVQGIGKSEGQLDQAIKSRAAQSKINYGDAGEDVITPDEGFRELLARPSMESVMRRAEKLAKEKGDIFKIGKDLPERTVVGTTRTRTGGFTKETLPAEVAKYPVQSLHYVKMAMDDLIKNPERFGIGANESGAIAATQKKFIAWLGEKSDRYNMAREAHKAASLPINEMQVGQELEKSLKSTLGTSERGVPFAKAVEDAPRTIKRATGQSMFESLDDVLKPDQVASVNKVVQELARKDAYERLAGQTRLSGKDAIPGDVGVRIPNILSRPAMIANFALRHAGEKAEGKIAELAAAQQLNPKLMADALRGVPPRYGPMIEALLRQQVPAQSGALMGRTNVSDLYGGGQ